MRAKEEVKSGTFNPKPNKKDKPQKDPDSKGLLDSTKHITFEGPKLKGMNKPLKPIPVFKQKRKSFLSNKSRFDAISLPKFAHVCLEFVKD